MDAHVEIDHQFLNRWADAGVVTFPRLQPASEVVRIAATLEKCAILSNLNACPRCVRDDDIERGYDRSGIVVPKLQVSGEVAGLEKDRQTAVALRETG